MPPLRLASRQSTPPISNARQARGRHSWCLQRLVSPSYQRQGEPKAGSPSALSVRSASRNAWKRSGRSHRRRSQASSPLPSRCLRNGGRVTTRQHAPQLSHEEGSMETFAESATSAVPFSMKASQCARARHGSVRHFQPIFLARASHPRKFFEIMRAMPSRQNSCILDKLPEFPWPLRLFQDTANDQCEILPEWMLLLLVF